MKTVYASCDRQYFFDHGQVLLKSCMTHGQHIHLDIINGDQSDIELVRKYLDYKGVITIHSRIPEVEGVDMRVLYACNRFHKAVSLLKVYDAMLIVDADSIQRKPIDWNFFKGDIGLYFRDPLPGTNEWETEGSRVAAGAVYLSNNAGDYIANVSKLIKSLGPKWFADQWALYKIYTMFKNHFIFQSLPFSLIDWEMDDDSTFWTGKGNRKFKNEKFLRDRKFYMARSGPYDC
jgi:hypothetical protein